MEEMGKLQDAIDAANGWDLIASCPKAMDALQCPRPRHAGERALSGGEPSSRGAVQSAARGPDLLLLGKAHQPSWTPESVLWLRSFCTSTPAPCWPSRTTATSWTTWPSGICEVDRGSLYPYKGNFSTYLETKAARMAGQAA